MKTYTGVGSRKVPEHIKNLITRLAKKLASEGWQLRSGGAAGSDQAFEAGAGDKKFIYRPFHTKNHPEAFELAKKFHPAWDRMSEGGKALHARNSFQILGISLKEPSRFVVCWTPDGATTHAERSIKTGGTGTAISIASAYDIPVFNLARPDHLERIKKYI